MFEVEMFIPVTNNEGETFSQDVFAAFEGHAVEAMGGFSLYPSNVIGGWRDHVGREVRDATRVYAFALASLEQGGAVVSLARLACARFRQDAIFIRYLGQAEIIR